VAPAWAIPLAQSIFSALAFLHGRGVIHRDIKPGNVLFDTMPDGATCFYLADFGLAVSLANRFGRAGSPFYLSPEILEESEAGPASDMWSFGITLGEALGLWCHHEVVSSTEDWKQKLENLGVSSQEVQSFYDVQLPEQNHPSYTKVALRRYYKRIDSMACKLPHALAIMLSPNPACRPSAEDGTSLSPNQIAEVLGILY
jgi:serine/threonine protein kinase